MATITMRVIVDGMLACDGVFPGYPQASSIWEYVHTPSGSVNWAVFWDEAHNDLMLSPHVGEYRCLWNRMAGHVNELGCLGG